MNETITEVLKGLTPVPAEAQSIADMDHPRFIAVELERLGKFIGVPGDGSGRFLNANAIAVIFGFGEQGALLIYQAYIAETYRSPQEAAATWDALRRATREAKAQKLLSWNLDSLKQEVVKGKPKLLIVLERDLDERLRAVAGLRGESLSSFVCDAIRGRLSEIEGRRAPAKRAEKEAVA